MTWTQWLPIGPGKRPTDLGVKDGRLKAPSRTDNSVSSQARLWPEHPKHESAQIDPLPLVGGKSQTTMKQLKSIVALMPGASIVDTRGDYLHAEFQSKLLKYVDDVEFWLDRTANVVQVRSASRLGQKDFGANRKRIEAIRSRLLASASRPGATAGRKAAKGR